MTKEAKYKSTDEFIGELKLTYDVEVICHNLDITKGWNPLTLKLNPEHFRSFISRYGATGKWRSVQYSVVDGEYQIKFYSNIGNDIISML